MSKRSKWGLSAALCLLVLAAVPCVAFATNDLIVHVEDSYGNVLTDAEVIAITSEGHLKSDQLPDGSYAFYGVGDKVTLEIGHRDYGTTFIDMIPSQDDVPKDPGFVGAPIHKTVVLGQTQPPMAPEQDPPPNDHCDTAIEVAAPSVTAGTTEGADVDDVPYCGVSSTSPGVWYSVIGTGHVLSADVCGATWDTKISVFCRDCDALFCIDGNDDDCGLQSVVTWCSEPGLEYKILVHGFGGAYGPFDLTILDAGEACEPDVVCPVAPENDLCENAIEITVPSVTTGTTDGASLEDTPDCGTYQSAPGVWYKLFGTGTTITATTCSDFYDYDTKLTVFCKDCETLTCVGGNDDYCYDGASGLLSTVTWCSQEGAVYLVLVHGFSSATGDFELWVTEDGVPCVADVACIPTGACCFPDASCADGLTEAQCEAQGGTYQGDGAVCGGGFIGWNPFEDCGNEFEDISGTGTPLFLGDDDGEIVPIGFMFNFWGVNHIDIGVCSNGYLTFGDDLTDFSNDPIPDTYDPNDFIAPLWDDLSPNQGGTVHYQTLGMAPNRRFIAQWTEVPQFYAGDSNTFQAILYEGTNCIEFRYGVITPEAYAGDYTVGIESPDGTAGNSIPGADVGEGVCKSICAEFTDPIVCPLEVPFDIKPTSCPNPLNTRSNGVLPVAILSTDDFDVYNVDPATVTLAGVAPIRWAYEDVATPVGMRMDVCDCTEAGPDGYMDLTFKFDRQAVIAALGAVTDGEYRPIGLMGNLLDGYPIYGWDCVWIKDKGNDPTPPPVISIGTFSGTSTTIHLSLYESTDVTMVIYDVQGKRVKTLVNSKLSSGDHDIPWMGRDQAGNKVANGVYFCRVKAGNIEQTVKMLQVD